MLSGQITRPVGSQKVMQVSRAQYSLQPMRFWQSVQPATVRYDLAKPGHFSQSVAAAPVDSVAPVNSADTTTPGPRCPGYPDCGCDGNGKIKGGMSAIFDFSCQDLQTVRKVHPVRAGVRTTR